MADNSNLIAKRIYPLSMVPGILRDGTTFSRPNWTNGQWVRFYRGVPLKMLGYKKISYDYDGPHTQSIPRGMIVIPASSNFNVYIGDANTVGFIPVDFFGNPLGDFVDRTPAGFAPDPDNIWQFDVMFATTISLSGASTIIAVAAPNLDSIDSTTERPIYYGDALDNAPLIPTGFQVSGGVVVLHPYLFMLGNNGQVTISAASNPTVSIGTFNIAPNKLLAGLPVRGGNTSPAGLIWTADRLIRVTQIGVGGSLEWNFDTVSADISVMSSTCMIEYDSQYYWMGVDRFLTYNGVVSELPNNMNLQYVFDRLNFAQRQKVWCTKVTAYGEIWWFYPSGDNTECDSVVIYNVREQTWYDTAQHRSCGTYSSSFAQPIWGDNTLLNGTYPIWLQEEGVDQEADNVITAIPCMVTSGNLSWIATDPNRQRPNLDRWMSIYRVEPDFIQRGPMTMLVNFEDYAAAPGDTTYQSGPYTFGPGTDNTVKIDVNKPRQGRVVSFTFASDVIGGYFEMGEVLFVATVGDGRQAVPS